MDDDDAVEAEAREFAPKTSRRSLVRAVILGALAALVLAAASWYARSRQLEAAPASDERGQ